uniref:G-protein coupled receptors family 1 profile domain-containing protein n=1 Tax=Graphocephala atropunctata TaxID=36148 RepID=A0A1B6KDT2_9HEMI
MNVSNFSESMNWTGSTGNETEHYFNPEGGYENWVPMSEEPIYEVPPHQVIILSFCYGSISVAAVLGNGLVIWVIATSRRMRSVTNYYIANLALADIVIGLFAIPFEFQSALLQRWIFPAFLCSFCPFVKVISVSVSVFTLAAIAVDRHRAILTPFTARVSKVQFKLVISFIWLVSGLMGAPYLFAMGLVKMDNAGDEYMYCYHVNLSKETMLVYHGTLVLLQYLVPLTIITWVYARMGLALWGATAPGNAQTERDANIMRNKKKVIKMLVIVVALFALCWLPLQTYNILQNVFPEINTFRYINIIWFSFDWLAMSNSCYNPFIYGIYNEKFKREFQMRLRMPCTKQIKRSEPLNRELSGLESSRFEWRRNSTINSKSSKLTSISLQ